MLLLLSNTLGAGSCHRDAVRCAMRLPSGSLICIALLLSLLPVAPARTQQSALAIRLPDRVRISERTNVSARVNGRYSGLISRQVTGYLSVTDPGVYRGRFFIYEQVRRDAAAVARSIDRSVESTTSISERTLFGGPSAYPTYQDLLQLPNPAPSPGQRWEAFSWILINPLNDPEPLRLPVYVDYSYGGIEPWDGGLAHRIEAQFATRYPLRSTADPTDPTVHYRGPITRVQGAHRMTILLPVDGGQVAFIRDEFREQYTFAGGETLEHEGSVLLFLNGLSVREQLNTVNRVAERIEEQAVDDVTVETTDVGVRLTVQELRFLPDQAVLVPEERGRLDGLARALAAALGDTARSRFLIVGHTADVGTIESQDRLSVERARTIASELAIRGVDPNLLDIEGRGGREPVASNENEVGRAQNRRVEIYLVEQ